MSGASLSTRVPILGLPQRPILTAAASSRGSHTPPRPGRRLLPRPTRRHCAGASPPCPEGTRRRRAPPDAAFCFCVPRARGPWGARGLPADSTGVSGVRPPAGLPRPGRRWHGPCPPPPASDLHRADALAERVEPLHGLESLPARRDPNPAPSRKDCMRPCGLSSPRRDGVRSNAAVGGAPGPSSRPRGASPRPTRSPPRPRRGRRACPRETDRAAGTESRMVAMRQRPCS